MGNPGPHRSGGALGCPQLRPHSGVTPRSPRVKSFSSFPFQAGKYKQEQPLVPVVGSFPNKANPALLAPPVLRGGSGTTPRPGFGGSGL